LARSRTGSAAGRAARHRSGSLTRFRDRSAVWQGIGYRPLPDAAMARPLFDFAAVHLARHRRHRLFVGRRDRRGRRERWSAPGRRAERPGGDAPRARRRQRDRASGDRLAARRRRPRHATARGCRHPLHEPQSLDRVWVRFGFIRCRRARCRRSSRAGRAPASTPARGRALWTLREAAASNMRVVTLAGGTGAAKLLPRPRQRVSPSGTSPSSQHR